MTPGVGQYDPPDGMTIVYEDILNVAGELDRFGVPANGLTNYASAMPRIRMLP